MRDFFQQTDRIYFDEAPYKKTDFATDHDKENIEVFRTEAGLNNTISKEQVFHNLRLTTKEAYFKNGAVLFFAKKTGTLF
ncbi:hypothetical protein ACM55M_14080 [Flavobacterium sp. ZT3R25]|uniref:hypothetical protein n=1 Tax=Flavobacterium galactosi TaxID=3398735 RepID=UPI003A893C96